MERIEAGRALLDICPRGEKKAAAGGRGFLEAVIGRGQGEETAPSVFDRMPMGAAEIGDEEKEETLWEKRIKAYEEAAEELRKNWKKQKLHEFQMLKQSYLSQDFSQDGENRGYFPAMPMALLLADLG